MPHWYLNTYQPLIISPTGRHASNTLGIPPFVDGSIRREPDLEHRFPSISCICRGGNFAPRLRVGDTVAYLTIKQLYRQRPPHHRLTAVLRVIEVFASHEQAKTWYEARGLPLPSNCMVAGNPCKPIAQSHGNHRCGDCTSDAANEREWDRVYQERVAKHPTFVVCEPGFIDLSWNAPIVHDIVLRRAFGGTPATRTPGAVREDRFQKMLNLLGVPVSFSGP